MLIQLNPDNWQGLTGKTSSGILIFSSPYYGTRAGIINMFNNLRNVTYYDFFNKYAPAGHGNNNPTLYAQQVASEVGVLPTDIITADALYAIGMKIVAIESGQGLWVGQSTYDRAFSDYVKSRGWNPSDFIKKKVNP